MSELAIKINIAGRVYPLNIKMSEEEAIRKAAKDIEENVKRLQDSYSVKDKQDLLAMTALQFASELSGANSDVSDAVVHDKLSAIDSLLDSLIK